MKSEADKARAYQAKERAFVLEKGYTEEEQERIRQYAFYQMGERDELIDEYMKKTDEFLKEAESD